MSDNKLVKTVLNAATFGLGAITAISFFVTTAGIKFFAEKALEKIINYELEIEESENISDAATPKSPESSDSTTTAENVEAE